LRTAVPSGCFAFRCWCQSGASFGLNDYAAPVLRRDRSARLRRPWVRDEFRREIIARVAESAS
jgi:hypothetical protein